MPVRLTDSRQPPFRPPHPEVPQVQQPMVYVYEKPRWEYKVVKSVSGEETLSEPELNALGAKGWELVGVVALQGKTRFFFKRPET